jgi:hypothetical protein
MRSAGATIKMCFVDWPAIVVQLLAMFIQLLGTVVAGRAERLQFPSEKRSPIAAMRLDVIGDRCRRRDAAIEAEPTQWFFAEVRAPDAAPALELVPATPILIQPWGLAFSTGFSCWM